MGERTDEVNRHGGGSRTESIRRDIDRTQHEIERTIDSLRYRLSPEHIMSETKQSIRRAGVNTSRTIIDRVKANPVPTAMVGVGLWLLFRNSNEQQSAFESDSFYDRYGYDRDEYNRGLESPYGYGSRRPAGVEYATEEGLNDRLSSAKDRVAEKMSSAREEVSERVDETREFVSDAVEHGRERLADLSEEARDRAWDLRVRANARMRQGRYAAREMFFDNPLVIGAAAIALGAIIGAAIPESEREQELMGSTRDRVADRAMNVAREKMDQAKDVASAAADAAKEAARDEAQASGLTDTPMSGSRRDVSGTGHGMNSYTERGIGSNTGSPGISGSPGGIGSAGMAGGRPVSPPRSGTTGTGRSDEVINPPGTIDPSRRR